MSVVENSIVLELDSLSIFSEKKDLLLCFTDAIEFLLMSVMIFL